MTTICLTLILKNNASTIQACIQSVRSKIHRYFLIDAASSDGTLELALQALSGIEGSIYKHPWVNSAPSVGKMLQMARDSSDYLLWIDPDEQLTVTDRFGFGTLDKDCYYAMSRQDGIDWRRPFLLRSSLEWKGGDFLPQDLFSPQAKTAKLLVESILWKLTPTAASEKQKFRAAYLKDPSSARMLFHYARASEMAGDEAEAIELYAKRALMGGDLEETFYSLYRIAALRDKQGEPLEMVIESYLKAYHFFPSRAEPLYDLAARMIRDENHVLAYVLSEFALTIPRPQEPFFLKSWIYEYGLLHQFVFSASQIKRVREMETALAKLLRVRTLPADLREGFEKNYRDLLAQKGSAW